MNHLCRRCTVLLLVGAGVASAAEPVAVRTAGELKANLGKAITARGVWSDADKFGSYVVIANGETVQISGTADQVNRLIGLWNGHRVRIVGRLRYFEIPAAKRAEIAAKYGATVAVPPHYYYVSIDDLRVEDEAHPELGLQWATHLPTRGDDLFMLYATWRPVNVEPRATKAVDFGSCKVPSLGLPAPHGGGYVSVYVDPKGRDDYLSGAKQLPRGTVIVKEKRVANSGGEPEELGMMIKRDPGFGQACGDWEFLYSVKAKKVVYDRAKTRNCRACHATRGAHDFVFREGLAKPSK